MTDEPEAEDVWAKWWPRARATGRFEALPVADAESERALDGLDGLQALTECSPLGALIRRTGGVLVDGGWLRLLGGGSPVLPSVHALSREIGPGLLVIGVDALGGVLALDDGEIEAADGRVHYWAPDSLEWYPLGMGSTAFMDWLLEADRVAQFYETSRWSSWGSDGLTVAADTGFLVLPPLFTEDGEEIEDCSVQQVPFSDVIGISAGYVKQAGGDPYPFTEMQWQQAIGST